MNGRQDNSSRKNACRSGMPFESCPAAGISGNRCINTVPSACPPRQEMPCTGLVRPGMENGAFCPQGPEILPARPYPQAGGSRAPQNALERGNYPVGMGYVPIQSWQQPYALETAFRRGTIFPDLDLPFMMGGAC